MDDLRRMTTDVAMVARCGVVSVQTGSVYKCCVTSASTIFQSICDIVILVMSICDIVILVMSICDIVILVMSICDIVILVNYNASYKCIFMKG